MRYLAPPLQTGRGLARLIRMSAALQELADDALVRRIAPGNPDAQACFRQLYDRHAQGVWLLLRSRLPQEADDLLQETWLRAWSALPNQYRPGHFRGWIFQIANNCLYDRLRRRRRTEAVDISKVAGRDAPPDGELLQDERREIFTRCLEKLPPRQREVVQARTAGEETDEVSRRLQLNSNSLYKLFHEARQNLTDCVRRALS